MTPWTGHSHTTRSTRPRLRCRPVRRALVVLVVAAGTMLAEIRTTKERSERQPHPLRAVLARPVLGDYQPVKNGRIGKRLARRAAGRVTRRRLVRLFR